MGWKRVLTDGILGDKKKAFVYENLRCPYGETCPSHIPFKNARPARVKFVERISPNVYCYRCKYCGCKFNYDVSNPDKFHQSELPYMKNPNFLHRRI